MLMHMKKLGKHQIFFWFEKEKIKMKTNDPKKLALLESLKGGLIVSCQTQKDEPIYTEDMVVKMAECAKWGEL